MSDEHEQERFEAKGERIVHWVVRGAAVFSLVALLIWPADWLIWRVREAANAGTGQFTVSGFTVASLKGNKEMYYYEGTEPAECSRSLFPHGGNSACWWLRRHPEAITRY